MATRSTNAPKYPRSRGARLAPSVARACLSTSTDDEVAAALAKSRSGARLHCALRRVACAPGRDAAFPAVTAPRGPRPVLARSERPWPVAVRVVCRGRAVPHAGCLAWLQCIRASALGEADRPVGVVVGPSTIRRLEPGADLQPFRFVLEDLEALSVNFPASFSTMNELGPSSLLYESGDANTREGLCSVIRKERTHDPFRTAT